MKSERNHLDRTDLNILRQLQGNGRMSNVELSQSVNLSPAPCLVRVKKLEKEGFISGYSAELDALKLGLGLLAYVEITLNRTTPDIFEKFKTSIQDIDEIEDCHMVAGGFDYLLKVRCRDMEDYRRILGEKIAAISGISQTHTYVVMEQVKTGRTIKI
ncbi:MAG: winged helix-turn-helix transcriptional regulator [Gammaproteobacteria bacterium]|nr:winged helix-turn-helix transcriptional regulator [Gammaproteobacteria bacterium]